LVFDGLPGQITTDSDCSAASVGVLQVGSTNGYSDSANIHSGAYTSINLPAFGSPKDFTADTNLRSARRTHADIGPPTDLRLSASITYFCFGAYPRSYTTLTGRNIDFTSKGRATSGAGHYITGESPRNPASAKFESEARPRLQLC
jgi:hypothetical protein